jgi:hypothetical protein
MLHCVKSHLYKFGNILLKNSIRWAGAKFIKIAKYTRKLQNFGYARRGYVAIRTNSFGDIIVDAHPDEQRNDDTRRLRFNQRGKLTGCIIRNA